MTGDVGETTRSRFWRSLASTALAVGGLALFVLVSFHAETCGLLGPGQLPLLCAL